MINCRSVPPENEPRLVAERLSNQQFHIYHPSIWQQITEVAHD